MLNEVKHLAKSPAESTERSYACFEISPPYSRRNDKNMISFSTHFSDSSLNSDVLLRALSEK